jgi:hypothetical protein
MRSVDYKVKIINKILKKNNSDFLKTHAGRAIFLRELEKELHRKKQTIRISEYNVMRLQELYPPHSVSKILEGAIEDYFNLKKDEV